MYSSAQGIAWRPDGKEIWYTAFDIGFLSHLYAVTLGGNDRIVLRSPSRLIVHDISPDGRVLLDSQSPQVGAHVLIPGETTERDLSWLDCSFVSDMSSDAKTIVIAEQGEGAGPKYSIYTRPTDGSPATRLSDGFGGGMSRDGKWVISQSATEGNKVMLVPTGAGTPRQLSSNAGDYLWPQFFPDGSKIYFGAASGSHPARLYTQAVDGGNPIAISPEGYGGS